MKLKNNSRKFKENCKKKEYEKTLTKNEPMLMLKV